MGVRGMAIEIIDGQWYKAEFKERYRVMLKEAEEMCRAEAYQNGCEAAIVSPGDFDTHIYESFASRMLGRANLTCVLQVKATLLKRRK